MSVDVKKAAPRRRATHFAPTSRLKAYDVVNDRGKDMGQVQNFIMDMVSGRIAYAVVSFRGFLGLSDRWIAVPFDLLAWQPRQHNFWLNLTPEELAQAPAIDRRDWPDKFLDSLESQNHRAWAERMYRFFGRVPFWVIDSVAAVTAPKQPAGGGAKGKVKAKAAA